MRPPLRSTRTTGSPSPSLPVDPNIPDSPEASDRPRPTLADIQIAPRRRLRDGSTSSRGSGSRGRSSRSRGTSVGSSSSRASSTRRDLSRRVAEESLSRRSGGSGGAEHPGGEDIRTRDHTSARLGSDGARGRGQAEPTAEGGMSVTSSRESSLSPLPSSTTTSRRPTPPQQRPRPASIIDMHDSLDSFDSFEVIDDSSRLSPPLTRTNRRSVPAAPYPLNLGDSPSVTSASTPSPPALSRGERRYTAREKGKGRAIVTPIEIDSSGEGEGEQDGGVREGDDSVQVINIAHKRRRSSSDGIQDGVADSAQEDRVEVSEEDSLGGGFSCPVCFCPPTQAVVTPCGHILCAQCLHSSLTAAIGRNPNPYPDAQPVRGGRAGRGARGGRGTRNSRAAASASANNNHSSAGGIANGNGNGYRQGYAHKLEDEHTYGPGPAAWTKEALQEYWYRHLVRGCERQLKEAGVPRSEWDAIMDIQVMKAEEVKVEHVLKGLWRVEEAWVVEGECPVCRNPLPGGYGPPDTGIGGIVPLQVRLSVQHKHPVKRRR